MTKKEILNIVKMKYGGNVDAFYKDYPTPESFKNGGSIPQYAMGGISDTSKLTPQQALAYSMGQVNQDGTPISSDDQFTAKEAFNIAHPDKEAYFNKNYPNAISATTTNDGTTWGVTPPIANATTSVETPFTPEVRYVEPSGKRSGFFEGKQTGVGTDNWKALTKRNDYFKKYDPEFNIDTYKENPEAYTSSFNKNAVPYTNTYNNPQPIVEPIAQNRNGGYLNSYNNGGKLPMYENGTNNAYMTNFSNTGTSTNYNAYMPNGIDYSQPASDTTFGATNYSADTLGQTFDTSTKGDNINAAVGAVAGSNPYSSAIYTGATMAQGLGESGINYEKDIYGNETNVPVAGSTHLASATKAPWEVASEAYSEGEYGKAVVAATIPVAGQLIGTQQITKQQEEFAKEQELAAGNETEFQKRKAFLKDRESSELDKANAAANTSGFENLMAEDGGYLSYENGTSNANLGPAVAEVEGGGKGKVGEWMGGPKGGRPIIGSRHEDGGVAIAYNDNGIPAAVSGGYLGDPIGDGTEDTNFVWSDNIKVTRDQLKKIGINIA